MLSVYQLCNAQFTRDTIASFDSITVENDSDIDSSFFIVLNRQGESINLQREETDSIWNYWSHLPAFQGENFYYTLGNTGSPAMSAYWSPLRKVGFDPAVHHLDLYRLESNDMQYYSTDRAYTMLHYNQTPQQTKSATNIKFGRAFNTQSGISIQYDRINDVGEYNHQKTRETSVGFGMYHLPSPGKKIFFSYTSNNFKLEENGGITSEMFFDDPTYDERSLIPTEINSSLAELKEREARLTATWNLGSISSNSTRGISLHYDGRYNSFIYKYADPDSSSRIYRQYSVHEDGQRAYVRNKKFSNLVGVSADYGASAKSTFNGRLAAYLEYQFHRYTQEFQTEDISNLLLHGKFNQQLSEKIQIDAGVSLDLGDQAGDYLLNGTIQFNPTKHIIIRGHLISQLSTPTGIMTKFRSLESEIYNHDFSPAKYNTIGGKIEYGLLGLSAEINNTIVTDHVYFSSNLEPEQISSSFNILQIKFGFKKQIGLLHTEHSIYLQNSSEARVPLPTYFSKHYVGGRWKVFKKRLQLDTGLDGVILPDFDGYGYFPLTGQFYPLQSTIQYGYTVNGIIGLRVDQFNVYFKIENMQTMWNDDPRYLVEKYPLYDARLRIGFRWLLRG